MKKIMCLLLSVCLMMGALCVTSAASSTDIAATNTILSRYLRFDFNGDKAFTTEDARIALKVVAGISPKVDGVNYDVNGDGKISVMDAREVLLAATGLIKENLTQEEILSYFVSEVNWVKTKRPGFSSKNTATCTSMRITTSGMPFSSLNVTNMEFKDYLDKNKTLFKLAMGSDEYDSAVAQAKAVYTPKLTEKTVEAASAGHYSYFPVNNMGWSSRLEPADIKNISFKYDGSYITLTVTMNNYIYADGNANGKYPADEDEYRERQALPYGKVFNLPSITLSEGQEIKQMDLKDGKVIVKIDASTGGVINADYSYNYSAHLYTETQTVDSNNQPTGKVIKTAMTQDAKLAESYVINSIAK